MSNDMIYDYREENFDEVLTVINDAATAYKGVISTDCWHEPYMSAADLEHEVNAGVLFQSPLRCQKHHRWGYGGAASSGCFVDPPCLCSDAGETNWGRKQIDSRPSGRRNLVNTGRHLGRSDMGYQVL